MGTKIAAELASFFKQQSEEHEGMQFEFHIQGHHKKKGSKERTAVWYERYVVLTLPPKDYVSMSKRMSFRPMAPKNYEAKKEEQQRQKEKRDGLDYSDARNVFQEKAEWQTFDDGVTLPPWWGRRK